MILTWNLHRLQYTEIYVLKWE